MGEWVNGMVGVRWGGWVAEWKSGVVWWVCGNYYERGPCAPLHTTQKDRMPTKPLTSEVPLLMCAVAAAHIWADVSRPWGASLCELCPMRSSPRLWAHGMGRAVTAACPLRW